MPATPTPKDESSDADEQMMKKATQDVHKELRSPMLDALL